jgi:hypothetical protein
MLHLPSTIVDLRLPARVVLLLAAIALPSCDRGSETRQRSSVESTTTTAAPPTTQATITTQSTTTQQSRQSGPPEKLYGTWVANDIDAKLGEVKIKLVFKQEGPVKILAWSDLPFVGQVRDKSAPYEATSDTISSDAIRGGTSVKYWFAGDQLVIQYGDGKTVKFRRA